MIDRPNILIVDDDPIAREVLRAIMNDLGAHLVFAESGTEALAKADECTPDLMLLDVMMPGLDGFEVCRRVRANPKLVDVPVVMATALDDLDSKLKALEAGADDFVTKPINRVELHARAQTILRLNRNRQLVKRQAELENALGALTTNFDAVLKAVVTGLDLRIKPDGGHTQRVTKLTVAIARRIEIREEELVHIRRGALLHDIGTLSVPEAILSKSGELTASERAILHHHPQYAHDLLSSIEELRCALDIPYCHHEHWDGTGYPRKLKGTEIPIAARIYAAADAWESMSHSDGTGKGDAKTASQYLESNAGTLFDPAIVAVLLDVVKETHRNVGPRRS